MIAIGNDVVDLAESPRNGDSYYQRLSSYALNPSERRYLNNVSYDLTLMLRLLWAVKEASYKSSNKLGNRDRFIPKNFTIEEMIISNGDVSGIVRFSHYAIKFSGEITVDFIHIVTQLSDCDLEMREEKILPSSSVNQSQALKNLVHDSRKDSMIIRKDEDGIPWLVSNHGKKEISLSHHGRFGAWACSK